MFFQGKKWRKVKDKVIKLLNNLDLLEGKKIIVGISGGQDSVLLLAVLLSLEKKYKFEFFPIHVHHHCSKEGDLYAKIAVLSSKRLGKECKIVHIEKNIPRSNVENWLREERYRLLEKCRTKIRADFIAVAHHSDDQSETILSRIFRGTGLWGLQGMKFQRNHIIRPLLNCSKKEIHELILTTDLPYHEDKLNYTGKYQRNRIRNVLIPLIERDFDPQISQHLFNLAIISQEYYGWILSVQEDFLKQINTDLNNNRASFDIVSWKSLSAFWRKEILRILINKLDKKFEVDFDSLERVDEFLVKNGRGEYVLKNVKIKVDNKRIVKISK